MNHSQPLAALWTRIDYSGIVLLMWGASIPSIHFGFICHPGYRFMHWTIVTLSAMARVPLSLHPSFAEPRYAVWRPVLHILSGLSAVGFLVHGLWIGEADVQRRRLAVGWMEIMAFLNLAGAGFYFARVSLSGPFHLVPMIALVVCYGRTLLTCGVYNRFPNAGSRNVSISSEPVTRYSMFWCLPQHWCIIGLC
jgi:predicted membrane channel-forming protein YqfA (hemolysin III family)